MIVKTEGILLHSTRFGESSLILSVLSPDRGILNLIYKGARKQSKGRVPSAIIQPSNRLEIIYYKKENQDLQLVKEIQLLWCGESLLNNPFKLVYTLVFTEILHSILREASGTTELYNKVVAFFFQINSKEKGLFPLFLTVLLETGKEIGFYPLYPDKAEIINPFFNPISGCFESGSSFDPGSEWLLYLINEKPYQPLEQSLIEAKTAVLELILKFYQAHIPGFRNPKSLGVFRSVFADS